MTGIFPERGDIGNVSEATRGLGGYPSDDRKPAAGEPPELDPRQPGFPNERPQLIRAVQTNVTGLEPSQERVGDPRRRGPSTRPPGRAARRARARGPSRVPPGRDQGSGGTSSSTPPP